MIQLFKPYMGEEECQAVAEVLKSGWIGLGPKTEEFERRFAQFIGVPHMVGVNSATAALDLAMRLLGVSHGHEVIVPTMTFVSTAHVAAYNLATPIFADIDPATLNLDIEDVAQKITVRTRAIIPVHYGGRPVDMDRLRQIAAKIPVVEDAAHACGGEYKGRKCGAMGKIGCFSFHAVKNLAMGDGGAIALHDEALAERAKKLRWLGIDKGTWDRSKIEKKYWWQYFVNEIGLKCHMNDIMAAIGLAQLQKLEFMNRRRREIAQRYLKNLARLPWLTLPLPDDQVFKSAWHIFCVQCDKRNELSLHLQDREITTGVHYTPIHTYSCYGNRTTLPKAERAADRILSLPMHPGLSDADVDRVCTAIADFGKQM